MNGTDCIYPRCQTPAPMTPSYRMDDPWESVCLIGGCAMDPNKMPEPRYDETFGMLPPDPFEEPEREDEETS